MVKAETPTARHIASEVSHIGQILPSLVRLEHQIHALDPDPTNGSTEGKRAIAAGQRSADLLPRASSASSQLFLPESPHTKYFKTVRLDRANLF
jgi:hypothetical protein